jgi:hypothetical protein
MGLCLQIKQKWAGNEEYFPLFLQLFLFFLSHLANSLSGVANRREW